MGRIEENGEQRCGPIGMRRKIIFFINTCSPTSIPVELAGALGGVTVVAFQDGPGTGMCRSLGYKNILYAWLSPRRFVSFIRNENPDIIHLHQLMSALVVRFYGVFYKKSRIVMTVHTDLNRFGVVKRVFWGFLLGGVHAIVANSQNTKNSILTVCPGINRDVFVIYNGVDVEKINEIQRSFKQEPHNPVIFGCIGRLEDVKNFTVVLRAVSKIRDCDFKVEFIGDGRKGRALRRLAAELHIEDKILFRGLLDRENTYKCLARMDCLIIPSRHEGFCNVLVEGMVAKKPVILSRLPVFNEIIDKGCFSFNGRDPWDLASKMQSFIDNGVEQTVLDGNYKKAVEQFGLGLCKKKYSNLYKHLAGE